MVAAMLMAANGMASLQPLKLVNNQLCTADNNPVQLRGWSTNDYKNFRVSCDEKADFERMKNSGATVIRIAVDPHEYASDLTNMVLWVKNSIDYCAELDLYCIIDWHILVPGDPNHSDYAGAAQFFYALSFYVASQNYHHVLYEICNEPNIDEDGSVYDIGQTEWLQIKTYAATILSVIKAGDPDAIVIVGTPQWDQGLVFPMIDPLDEMGMNVMYSFHSNTGDEENYLGLLSSASAFLPIFVSEWRLLKHSGDACSFEESKPVADLLMNICNGQNLGGQKISWCNWGWYQKNDVGSAFTDYDASIWSQSGNYVKALLAAGDNFITRATTTYETQEFDGENDFLLALEKYDLGGPYNAFWDWDENWVCNDVWTSTHGCNGGLAGKEDGVRANEMVDLGYAGDKEYISLDYTSYGEWVQYTINAAYAGDYDFELYTNNYNNGNIIAFAVDGQNALVDEDGNVFEQALKMQPCHGGSDNWVAYNEWGWTKPKSLLDADKKFRLRLKQGEQKLALVFMEQSSGLGTIKLKGYEHQGIEAISAPTDKAAKYLIDGALFITLPDGKIYNATGKEVK